MSFASDGRPAYTNQGPSLEVAHILFMDIVAFSRLPNMEAQTAVSRELQEVVSSTEAFRDADSRKEILCRPTGDGMALIFFRDMLAPARCAVEIATSLRNRPHIQLRMGLHSGPVYIVKDINAHYDVSGEGIVTAQRVMDCGDAGHILLSSTVAELIGNAVPWSRYLQDLGSCPIKHGKQIRLFGLQSRDFGNKRLPERVRLARREAAGPGPWPGIWRAGRTTAALALLGAAIWFAAPRLAVYLPALNPALSAHPRPVTTSARSRARSARRSLPAHHPTRRVAAGAPDGNAAEAYGRPRLLPSGSTAAAEPASDPEVQPDDQMHSLDRVLEVPRDHGSARQVKVEFEDNRSVGALTVVDGTYGPGDRIPVHIDYAGRKVTLRAYYNDDLVKEWKLVPPPVTVDTSSD